MSGLSQTGYLLIADISGYTSYVARTELEHSQAVLTELLELILAHLSAKMALSKLEGDAVFVYAPAADLARGETVLELVEATYTAFRGRVEAINRRTTCPCRACRAIPTLDLKFVVHHGVYIEQRISGIHELVGTDVNLVHRMMKNRVSEETGWKAYALFTAAALEQMDVQPVGMHPRLESYDHLGEVQTYSLNLMDRYNQLISERRAYVSEDEALVSFQNEFSAPPPVVWEWLNDPHKRAQCGLNEGIQFVPLPRPEGRTLPGARNHCVHGDKVAMVETILDWRPFDYFTVEQLFMGFQAQTTYQLQKSEDGRATRMVTRMKGKAPGPGFLNDPVFRFALTRIFDFRKIFVTMGKLIEQEGSPPDTAFYNARTGEAFL